MKKQIVLSLFSVLALSAHAQQTCNVNMQETAPDSRFNVDTVQQTVTDSQTGLMWMRCSLGQSGNDCSGGSATEYNWQQALALVAATNATGSGGYYDWRLPNIKELASIVEVRCHVPAINANVFPNTQSGFYWSSSPDAHNNDFAWSVIFHDGKTFSYLKDGSFYVRLVRGGQ